MPCNDNLSASEVFETAVEHELKTMSWAEFENDSFMATSSQVSFANTGVDCVNEWC